MSQALTFIVLCDSHEAGIVKSHFTDVETEVWGGHSAAHSEKGIKAGSHPILGGMQSPQYQIPLRQSLCKKL